jgi:hypothetical protein
LLKHSGYKYVKLSGNIHMFPYTMYGNIVDTST